MATDVIMPQMGESIAEGTITRWLVEVGQEVQRDQPLLEISTDKVDAEIPSPASGKLLEVLFVEGQTVEVDTVIARIGATEEAAAPRSAPASAPTAATEEEATAEPAGPREVSEEERVRRFSSPVVRKIAAAEEVALDEVEGTGIHGRVTKRDILQYLEEREGERDRVEEPAPEHPAAAARSSAEPAGEAAARPGGGASRAAASREEQPAAVPASGATAAEQPPRGAPAAGGGLVRSREEVRPRSGDGERSAGGQTFSVPAYTEDERVDIEPMTPIRRLTAAHMLYSQQTSAHVATVFDVDMSGVVAARNRAKDKFLESTGTKLTFMPFLFKAVIDGLRTYRKFNASIDGTDVVYKKDIHLGMAVALDWGLIVPVIEHADRLNLVGLATKANDLADRARLKRLRPEEVRGGTFTVTNPGVYGSLFGIPMINQPQVAILCFGAIEKRPVVITDAEGNDGIGIRWMANVSLSYDHRLIDGADAEQFMVRVKQTLTDSSWEELSAYFPSPS
ncbi:MAG TPA: 2-oxo acid dehydrogenase subunit E2 [Thermoanaerobaculia bacterium]|nr:2-oxo acid dehydrogenase subunit E2 [Thermoanaerobaculia bacterium]